jgi:hypothetical protein
MKKPLLLIWFTLTSWAAICQSFEITDLQESYKGTIGDLIKAPLHFKNTTEKIITLVIRRIDTQIGSSQKNVFCPDNNCLDQRIDDYYILKIEPGQNVQNFWIGLEAGLTEGFSVVKYTVYNKSNPVDARQLELNFVVEAKPERSQLYTSPYITIHDVYPNPVTAYATIEYQLHVDQYKAKIIIHNILGNAVTEYELPFSENRIKILADQFNSGIYFYTLYVDNEGVMTRKLIVKK